MATQLKDEISIEQILAEMSVEEKACLVIGGSPFHSEKMEKYGIPAMYMLDSCNGINAMEYAADALYLRAAAEAEKAGEPFDREKNGFMGGLLQAFAELHKSAAEKATSDATPDPMLYGSYPPGISYGSTWNPDVVRKCSTAMAKEMGSYGIDMVLGPNINIHRDPLCGRLAESISEDPYLASSIAVAQVEGIQEEGMIACAKHFAANNQEKDRLGVEEHVPERALREIYLPAFKACVDAGVGSLMSAYNKLNGKPSAMNDDLLTGILRDEWGFDGFVVSDWGASYDQIAAVAAGTDLTMPGPRGVKCIEAAVADGRLPEAKLDTCVRNFLRILLRSTAMTGKYPEFSMEESVSAAEEAAREGMILLKNDGTLPIPMDSNVVFYGKRSKSFVYCPEGSSKVVTSLSTNPFDRVTELLGENNVSFEKPDVETKYWIVTVGANGHEGSDRNDMSMDADEHIVMEKAIHEAKKAGGKVIVIINATGPIDLSLYIDDINAVLCPFFAGMQGGKAAADAVFGLYNPSGKLPLTWPKRCCDTPAYKNYPGENKEVWYGEGMYVGYRWYDARQISVTYPFGYGLSYTTFELSGLETPETVNIDKENVIVRIRIKNTGTVAGSEVVQLYVHDPESKIDKPYKQLKGFQKVFLQPDEEKTVSFTLKKESFAGYSLEMKEWVTEPGDFDILVGTSSGDLPFASRIKICCKNPYGYSDKTAIGVIAGDQRAVNAVNRIIHGDLHVIAKVAIEFGPDTAFGAVWNGNAMQKFFIDEGITKEQSDEMRRQLQLEFDQIEVL